MIRLLLPCSVVVREVESTGVRVEVMDPRAVRGLVDWPKPRSLPSKCDRVWIK